MDLQISHHILYKQFILHKGQGRAKPVQCDLGGSIKPSHQGVEHKHEDPHMHTIAQCINHLSHLKTKQKMPGIIVIELYPKRKNYKQK